MKTADLPDKDHAYGWDNVITKEAAVAIMNAENYAFLGLWAAFADLGYTLPRLGGEGLSEEDRKEREEDAVQGYMNRYVDVTKRIVKAGVAVAVSFEA